MTDPSRIDSILGEWLEKRDRGETLDPEEVIRAHPDLEEELRRRFRALSLLEEARDASRHLRPLPAERYGDFRVAGEGGMGIVYWALDTDLNRQVAFKIVRPHLGGDRKTPSVPIGLSPPDADTPASQAFETLKARFLQEAWVTAGLEHPGIVPVYELGETPEGVPYYTMRFVRGSRTLATAIEEAKEGTVEDRLALLEPFLRVCDTIRYAHAHDVVHRDLKPENVAIGEFGEVVVLDWGLAKLRGEEDRAAETWQERLKEYREATDLRTMASALGTPGYMSPEASLGKTDEVDERSDVYSLGAMLFEILTGRLPFTFETYIDLVMKLKDEDPPAATELDAAVPEALSEICARAIARVRGDRYAGPGELAEAIRTWQRESAAEREVRELLAKAEAAFEGTEGLEGEALLKQLDRVKATCSRITEKQPDHPRAAALVEECGSLRGKAMAERERAARGKLLGRVAALVAVLLIVVGAVVVLIVDAKRREAEAARIEAVTQRDAKEAALLQARALGLASASAAAENEDGMLSLLLAREAARLELHPTVVDRLRKAVRGSLERVLIPGHRPPESGLEADSCGASFSPDGRRILSWSNDGMVKLWDLGGTLIRIVLQVEPLSSLGPACFLPDGETLLVSGELGADEEGRCTWLIDLSGARQAVLPDVIWATVAPKRDCIVAIARDGTVSERDLEGRLLHVLFRNEHMKSVEGGSGATVAPDGGMFAVSGFWVEVQLLDRTGQVVTELDDWSEWAFVSLAFSPSGEQILTGHHDGTARLRALEGEDMVVFRGHAGRVNSVEFSTDGRRIVTASDDGTARIWDTSGRKLAVLSGHDCPVYHARFSPDDERILTMGEDGRVRVWDTEERELPVFRGARGDLTRAEFMAGGDRVLTFGEDVILRIYDRHGRPLRAIEGHGNIPEYWAVVSPGGDAFVLNGTHLHDLEGREIAALRERQESVTFATFSPTGRFIATASDDLKVRIWERSGKLRTVLQGFQKEVEHVAFSATGELVATSGGTTRIFSLEGELLRTLPAKGVWTTFSPDGTRLAVGDWQKLGVWSIRGRRLGGPEVGDVSLPGVFSTGGDRLLTGSWHPRLSGAFGATRARIHDGTGNVLAELIHGDQVTTAVFSPDGRRILTASLDGTARLWDRQGRETAVLRGHREGVISAFFSPDGRRILTASLDGTARIWLAHEEDLLRLADRRVTRDFTPEERERWADLLEPAEEDRND